MFPLCSTEEMRQLDQFTIQSGNITSLELMERAGQGVAHVIKQILGEDLMGAQVTVFAGAGNNGGDGMVIAHHVSRLGAQVRVLSLCAPSAYSPDCAKNAERVARHQIPIIRCDQDGALRSILDDAMNDDVWVDAMFGTGLSRPLTGRFAEVCQASEQASAFRIAVDIPSGIDGTTGAVLGAAFQADETVTIGGHKWGLYKGDAPRYTGKVTAVDIGILPQAIQSAGIQSWVPTAGDVAGVLGPRAIDSHKGTHGHLLILAGSPGKVGAANLAARGALRTGVGKVTVGIQESLRPLVHSHLAEVMTLNGRIGEGFNASISEHELSDSVHSMQAVAIGPGLGEGMSLTNSLFSLLHSLKVPAVLDADALRLCIGRIDRLRGLPCPLILTPHPGELADLLGWTTERVQSDRKLAAQEAARASGQVVVLKGYGTITALPWGETFLNSTGGPWMATAGSGDVLTGCIGALLAAGVPAAQAAWCGAYLHGLAGDVARGRIGPVGVLASEIADALPETRELLG